MHTKFICFTPQSKHTIIKFNDAILQEPEDPVSLILFAAKKLYVSMPIKFS